MRKETCDFSRELFTSIRFGLQGPNISHVTTCSTGLHCFGKAAWMIRRGGADGAIVLEEFARGADIYAELVGYALTGDAYHLTLPSMEGPMYCMLDAVKRAGLRPEDIDYLRTAPRRRRATPTKRGPSRPPLASMPKNWSSAPPNP